MPGRKVFADSVVELPLEDGLAPNGLLLHGIGPRHDDEPMDVMFSLELPTNVSAELEDSVARGEVVSAKELAGMTAPQEVQERLVAWLTSHGFTVDHISADGTSVYATSTVSNISEQLQVEMARVTRDGITYNAARTAPTDAETAWIGSGGGSSIFFPRPAWQTGPGVPDGDKRLVPDVALAANPNTGALVVLHGKELQIGGTSWSAPVWAGFCALINEALESAGMPALGFANPTFYQLAGTAAFRDITVGTNGAFTASKGYDRVTGIGVPDLAELIKALAV